MVELRVKHFLLYPLQFHMSFTTYTYKLHILDFLAHKTRRYDLFDKYFDKSLIYSLESPDDKILFFHYQQNNLTNHIKTFS